MKRTRGLALIVTGLSLTTAAWLCSNPLSGGRAQVEELVAEAVEEATVPTIALAQSHRNEGAGFSMDLPEDWVAMSMITVTVAAPSQEALEEMNTGDKLTTPVIMAMIGSPEDMTEGATTVDELTEQMLSDEFKVEEGMTVSEPVSLTVGGLDATSVDFSGLDPDSGQEITARMITVLGVQHAGVFFGMAPTEQWNDFSPTFDAIIATVAFFEPNPEAAMEGLGEMFNEGSVVVTEDDVTFTGDLGMGQTMSGVLEDGGIHYWSFTGAAGQTVIVTVEPGSDGFDVTLAIVGSDGNVLSEIDDGFSGEPETLSVALPADGTYIARVSSFAFVGGPYTITATGGDAPVISGGELRQWAAFASASSEYGSDSWAAYQATGAPNTYPQCGDIQTAWASASSSGVDTLTLDYATPVVPTRLEIYQTLNPGAISKIELVDVNGNSHVIYGATPTVMDVCPFVLAITIDTVDVPVKRVIIHIDQSETGVWCEIDAVELIGTP